ncbi:MAG: EAL domain-containing protein [Ruminococcus sp.]|nr:EAL domain-containing protein [Ruminococcus sp.]
MDIIRKKRLDSMFDTLSIIAEGNYIYLCDMKTNYSRWSETAVDYFNLPNQYMYNAGTIWEECIHPEDRERYRMSIDNIFSGRDKGHSMQYRAKAGDGNYVVCTCRGAVIKDENGDPEYFAGAIKNHGSLSYIDTITGLRSLYGFFDDLKTLIWKKIRTTAIVIGVTGFSIINDVYGYKFGNKVIRQLADIINDVFTNSGAVYRMDGIKFAVLTQNMNETQITALYRHLQELATHTFFIDDERLTISLNAGMMVIDDFEIESETVYSCLKYAYYESKNKRLGNLAVFERIMNNNKNFIEKLNVIRNSVIEDCEGFFLCYQPIMYADTEKLKGMEALIRWRNDKYGTVPPVQFVPVLEQDSLFPELGKWILRRAMTDGKLFLEKYPDFIMNVNISYAQLERSDFVSDVFSILEETKFPPENLCLEITERCRLLDVDVLNNMFKIFREHGIKIALDDFGTGFSSLGVLRTLPIDTVKIDREFVKNIEKSTSDQSTVKFISSLADAFKAEVCVEGVETVQMRDFLRNYGIKSFQGYYYSKPVPADEFIKKDF